MDAQWAIKVGIYWEETRKNVNFGYNEAIIGFTNAFLIALKSIKWSVSDISVSDKCASCLGRKGREQNFISISEELGDLSAYIQTDRRSTRIPKTNVDHEKKFFLQTFNNNKNSSSCNRNRFRFYTWVKGSYIRIIFRKCNQKIFLLHSMKLISHFSLRILLKALDIFQLQPIEFIVKFKSSRPYSHLILWLLLL